MFLKQFKDSIKNCQGVFDNPLRLLLAQSVESLSELADEDFVFLKRVIEKLKTKQVSANLHKQAVNKLELVEKRSGKRKVLLIDDAIGERFLGVLVTFKEMKAEVLHVKADYKVRVRIGGALHELADAPIFSMENIQNIVGEYISPAYSALLAKYKVVDFSLSIPGLSRFRVTAYYEENKLALTFKQIPFDIPSLSTIKLEKAIIDVIDEARGGLFIVSGPAVSGKSTTVAAILNHLNQQKALRILTFEDPIEYLLKDQKSSVTQREIGSDMQTLSDGLHYILKGGPNWLFLSSVNSLDVLEYLITVAESGVNVIISVASIGVIQALENLTAFMPKESHQHLLDRFSKTLNLCFCQHLYKNKLGVSAPIREYLIPDANLRNLIREGRFQGIISQLDSLNSCRSLHKRAFELVSEGEFDFETLAKEIEDYEGFDLRYRKQLQLNEGF